MYEIWHSRTNNIIDWFDTAIEAESVIVDAIRDQGLSVLSDAYLVKVDSNGDASAVADGEAMLVAIKRLAAEERDQAAAGGGNRRVG